MNIVTISRKFEVVIPLEIRERLALRPGQRVRALAYDNRVEFIPERPLKSTCGFCVDLIRRSDESATACDRVGQVVLRQQRENAVSQVVALMHHLR